MSVPREHYVRIGPISTRYWVEGNGTPVVLVHGLGGSATGWLLSFDAISSQHRVYALDLIGHGKTSTPNLSRLQFSDLVEFLCEFLSILGIESAHLVGHSMGGAIALRLAMEYPERVNKLVLVDAAGLGKEISPLLCLTSIRGLGEFLLSRMYTPDAKKFGENVRASSVHPDFITDELVENIYAIEQNPTQHRSALRIMRLGVNMWGQKNSILAPILKGLPTLAHPTLVVWGRQDELLPIEHGELAAKKIPGARLEIIDNCGHTPMFDQPEILNQLLLEFLKN